MIVSFLHGEDLFLVSSVESGSLFEHRLNGAFLWLSVVSDEPGSIVHLNEEELFSLLVEARLDQLMKQCVACCSAP